MHILGGILIVVGIVLFFVRQSAVGKLLALSRTETYTAKSLAELVAATSRDVGQGQFRHPAEVKGQVACDQPLTSGFSKDKCVAFQNEVEWEYEETVWEEDPQTRQRRQKTVKKTETISRSTRTAPFAIADETGRVEIDPEGAEIEWLNAVDRFEPETAATFSAGQITLGGFAFPLLAGFQTLPQGRRTLGYRYREQIFPIGRFAFVLGEATDARGKLMLARPTLAGGRFLITTRSEDELLAGTRQSIKYLGLGAAACGLVGVILLAVGLLI